MESFKVYGNEYSFNFTPVFVVRCTYNGVPKSLPVRTKEIAEKFFTWKTLNHPNRPVGISFKRFLPEYFPGYVFNEADFTPVISELTRAYRCSLTKT